MLKSLLDGDHHLLDHISDDLAEAINKRGGTIPCHYSQLLKLSSISEEEPSITAPKSVMDQLLADHQQVVRDLDFLIILLQQDNDQPIERLLQNLLERVNSGMLNLNQAISILNIQ
ncbi:ferritin-like domain-containing protein [Leptolyngbya ectocarpi]|nr:ferritin-like domain-containing protein [Leptolyngbya ectocarpi]